MAHKIGTGYCIITAAKSRTGLQQLILKPICLIFQYQKLPDIL